MRHLPMIAIKIFLLLLLTCSLCSNEDIFKTGHVESFLDDQEKELFKELRKKSLKKHEKRAVFFYLTSSSVPINTFTNILSSFTILKRKFPHYELKFALRGMGTYNEDKEYINKFNPLILKLQKRIKKDNNFTKEMASQIKITLRPTIFKELNITRVPVFLFAECSGGTTRKKCDFKYKLSGDVSLEYFISTMADFNHQYKNLSRSIR